MRWIFIVVLLAACSNSTVSNQQKAEASVKEFLKKNLNDPSSYQPGEFGKLDSIKVDTTRVNELRKAEESLPDDDLLKTLDNGTFYDSLANSISDSMHKIGKWQILHSYRAKNAFGAFVLTNDVFYLDSNFAVKKSLSQE